VVESQELTERLQPPPHFAITNTHQIDIVTLNIGQHCLSDRICIPGLRKVVLQLPTIRKALVNSKENRRRTDGPKEKISRVEYPR
jgi:hypothetical protein